MYISMTVSSAKSVSLFIYFYCYTNVLGKTNYTPLPAYTAKMAVEPPFKQLWLYICKSSVLVPIKFF